MKHIVLFASCCAAFAIQAAEPQIQSATAAFVDAAGRQIGTATLRETPEGVLIEVQLRGVPPGEHAFHVHETGECETAARFESAGDHYAPRGKQHGYLAKAGPHSGDMPNQFAATDGALRASVLNPGVTLTKGPASLFDADGSALILHAKRDDYSSQPSGDAGDRIACAVAKRAARVATATSPKPEARSPKP